MMEDMAPSAAPPPSLPLDPALLAVLVESYEGPLDKEGRYSGRGRAVLRDTGSVYEGDFALGSLHGEGTYTWKDGIVYHGSFVENCIMGIGNYTWPGGAQYKGGVLSGLRHGYGVLHFDDSVVRYEGEWKNGRRHGTGTLWYDDNGTCCYRGQWRDDKRHGEGELRYASGNVYRGEFFRDIKEGKGTMHWVKGKLGKSTYTGDWVKGMPHGRGEQVWDPEAASPWPGKEGITHLQLQNRYVGDFKDGQRHGKGTFWYATGAQYIGEWHENLKHGKGVFTYEDGTEYSGFFEDDRPVARGSPMKLPSRHVTLDLSSLVHPGIAAAQVRGAAREDASHDGSADRDGGGAATEVATESVVDEVSHDVLNLLLRYNSELRLIYKHYARGLPGDPSLQTLALPQLWNFLYESRIVASCLTYADIDEIARTIISAKREPDHPSDPHSLCNHLLYREFLELLVHIAHHRFSDIASLEMRVQRLLKRHVIKFMPETMSSGPASPRVWRTGAPPGFRAKTRLVVKSSLTAHADDSSSWKHQHFEACQRSAILRDSNRTNEAPSSSSTCTLHEVLLYLARHGIINAADGVAPSTAKTARTLIDALYPGVAEEELASDALADMHGGGGATGDASFESVDCVSIFALSARLVYAEFCAALDVVALLRGGDKAGGLEKLFQTDTPASVM